MVERFNPKELLLKNEGLKIAINQGIKDYECLAQGKEIEVPKLIIKGRPVELDWKPIPNKKNYYTRYYSFLVDRAADKIARFGVASIPVKVDGEKLSIPLYSDSPIKAQIAGFGLKALEEGDIRLGYNACNLAGILLTEEVARRLEKFNVKFETPNFKRKLATVKTIVKIITERQLESEKKGEKVFHPQGYVKLLEDFSPLMSEWVKTVPFSQQEATLLFKTIDDAISEANTNYPGPRRFLYLEEREKTIIRELYGLNDGLPKTKEDLGQKFQLKPSTVNEIKKGVFYRLNHSNNKGKIFSLFGPRASLKSLPLKSSPYFHI